MSSLGEPWENGTPDSASKKNLMQVPSLPGADIAALDKSQHKLVVCTETGSGFTIDHLYLANVDADEWIDVTSTASHTHRSTATGGTLERVFGFNGDIKDLWLTSTANLKKAQWIETVTGTGSIEDNTDGTTGERATRLRPNGTSGSGATISYPHLKLNWANPSSYNAKLRIETATSLALHSGVGADDITAADSNTRKYNAEVCTATNDNWFLRTANGTSNSASDSGIDITANRTAITIDHDPTLATPQVDLYVETNSVFSKTTHVPTDNATADVNLLKHSIKNSTAADRPLLVYGTRISYKIKDDWFKQT